MLDGLIALAKREDGERLRADLAQVVRDIREVPRRAHGEDGTEARDHGVDGTVLRIEPPLCVRCAEHRSDRAAFDELADHRARLAHVRSCRRGRRRLNLTARTRDESLYPTRLRCGLRERCFVCHLSFDARCEGAKVRRCEGAKVQRQGPQTTKAGDICPRLEPTHQFASGAQADARDILGLAKDQTMPPHGACQICPGGGDVS